MRYYSMKMQVACKDTTCAPQKMPRLDTVLLFCFFGGDLFSNDRFARLSNIEQNETLDKLLQEKREVKGKCFKFLLS